MGSSKEGSTPGGAQPEGALVVRDDAERALAKVDPQLRVVMAEQFTDAQISFLLQRTPRREIRYREGPGGKRLAYVEHAYVTEKLNQIFGFNWDLEVVEQHLINNEAIVKVRLTVPRAA
jgi:recombination DNA repair RAD52 pathway protein